MNKKELIEKIEDMPAENYKYRPYIDKKLVLGLVRQLDEPQKQVVPPVVSVWYLINKDNLYKNIAYLCANWVKSTTTDDTLFNWMSNTDNFIQILVNMHKFGYEVEKEKRYLVKVKGICGKHETLNREKHSNKWLFSDREENSLYGTHHTRKELEDAGFSEVFNSPLFEVEEVE